MAYQKVTSWELARFWGPRKGTRALHDVVMALFGHVAGVRSGGIYNRRSVRGGISWSLHAVGRAFDIMCPINVGTMISAALIVHHKLLGVNEVIHNRMRWTPENGCVPYRGANPHTDHVHVGMTREVADAPATVENLKKWFTNVLTDTR